MEQVLIKAEKRVSTGKGVARKLRSAAKIPAILYGGNAEPVSITISAKDWDTITRHMKRNVILNMQIHSGADVESRPVMVKEIQHDGLGTKILHIDFFQVSMDKRSRSRSQSISRENPRVKFSEVLSMFT
ncbi:MAG: 50S ribosomal protein L25 [Syntrophorhabdus sp.]